ncbi:DUF4175 domain-containing protein [Acidomonas methanolica]|uniref:DUF4175 domain-containing protein n=1 Tax=Acidomonas methanolica TaxID=437 RepID=UPI00211A3AD9|nr:DUF4175 family protein [Acidomonas methanolica]MCQ9154804.1 DUF4175 family protein [Acidomonas methanolica]
MSATTLPSPDALAARIARARRQARRVLLLERCWPALRLPLLILGLYLLASLWRIPQSLSDWLHAILEAGLAALGGTLALRTLRRIAVPGEGESDRRVEHASRLPFQPLLTLTDHASGSGEALWSVHAWRVARTLGPLRAGWPRPALTRPERWTAATLLAALALSALVAGSHAPSRIYAGFVPGQDDADVPLPQIQAWIDMPDYAPGAPVFLNDRDSHAEVPQGARLTATVTDTDGKPYFAGAPIGALETHRLDSRSWSLKTALEGSGRLALRVRGRDVASWRLTVQPDLPPAITWNGTPGKTEEGWATEFRWKTSQAHGVRALEAEIRLKSINSTKILRVPLKLDGTPKEATGDEAVDLSANPWAGEEVSAVLRATSVSGLDGRSRAVTFRLPARPFHDPIARALVALRRRLALGQENRITAANELRALTDVTPVHETGVILAMLLSASALTDSDDPDAPEEVIGLTWAAALYLEDIRESGRDIALANLDIRAAQAAVQAQIEHMRQLGAAGQKEAEQEELARRMKTLRDALNRRMQLLMRDALSSGLIMPDMGDAQEDADDAFSRLMQRLQSDAANGHEDDALKRLQQLQSMTQAMRKATPQDLMALAHQIRAQQRAALQRQALHDLVRHETGLLDHAQSRLSAARRATATDQDEGTMPDRGERDLATMSTAELLRRLGIRPPADMDQPQAEPQAPVGPLPAELQAKQSEQRRADHALQRSLQHASGVLNDDVKDLVGKKIEGLTKAGKDMAKARKALAAAKDIDAQTAEIQVLKDLAEAGKQMRKAQQGKSHGGGPLALLPSMGRGSRSHGGKPGKGQGEGEAAQGSDAQTKNLDPLGRKLGEGDTATDSDGHIPEASQRDRAREIERELRRRDSDRTRPQSELDYLDRLLKSY